MGEQVSADFIPWSEQGFDWGAETLPLAKVPGWHRAHVGRFALTEAVKARVTYLPLGQSSPFHHSKLEYIMFQLEGEVEFRVGPKPGELTPYRLGKYDALVLPDTFGFEFSNVGMTDAWFLGIASRSGDKWPDEMVYYMPGEDEPIIRNRPGYR